MDGWGVTAVLAMLTDASGDRQHQPPRSGWRVCASGRGSARHFFLAGFFFAAFDFAGFDFATLRFAFFAAAFTGALAGCSAGVAGEGERA